MYARTGARILAAVTTFALLAGPAAAQPQPRPADRAGGNAAQPAANAALQYWQAFAHMPQLGAQQQELLAKASDPEEAASADADALAKLAESGKDALLSLRRGAAVGPCDWGLHPEDGPYLLLPHLAKGRDLSRIALLQTRLDFARGDDQHAVETAADALVLARHLSGDPTAIVSYLVQLGVERAAVETLASNLAGLDASSLDALDRRLASLPPGGSIEACVRVERELGIGWAVDELRKMKDQDPWQERVLNPFVIEEGVVVPQGKADALAASAGGSREAVLKRFESLGHYYDELGQILPLPRAQFQARLAEIEKETADNPIAKAVLPAMPRVYDHDAAGRTRMNMLKAASAVVRGGPEKARDFKDATGAAIEYQAAPGGFELRSKVIEHDKPVTLKVGGK